MKSTFLLSSTKRIFKLVLPFKMFTKLRALKNSLYDKRKFKKNTNVFNLNNESLELISNNGIIDLRRGINHPCSLLYTSSKCKEALLTGNIQDGRTGPYNLKGKSYLVCAAMEAVSYGIEKKDVIEKMKNVLSLYYERDRLISASQWLGLSFEHKLTKFPKWAAVYPWTALTVDARLKKVGDERKSRTRNDHINGTAVKLDYIIKKMSKNGFIRSNDDDGDVFATALVDNSNNWRWLITSGNHRAVCASVLGYNEIPVRINSVIKRGDVKYWPNVTSGLYTENEALNIFDRFFESVSMD